MTLKIKLPLSIKKCRKLHRIPACKRIQDYFDRGWLKRYNLKNKAKGR